MDFEDYLNERYKTFSFKEIHSRFCYALDNGVFKSGLIEVKKTNEYRLIIKELYDDITYLVPEPEITEDIEAAKQLTYVGLNEFGEPANIPSYLIADVEEILRRYHSDVEPILKYLNVPKDIKLNQKPNNKGNMNQVKTFHFNKPKEELVRIFQELVKGGFIKSDCDINDWLCVCGRDVDVPFTPLVWMAKNKKSKQPSKKSLIDFLLLVGASEKEIRSCINCCFKIDGGKAFRPQDLNYRNWNTDIKSEYHSELEKIVRNI